MREGAREVFHLSQRLEAFDVGRQRVDRIGCAKQRTCEHEQGRQQNAHEKCPPGRGP
jgi:hypothetical protein